MENHFCIFKKQNWLFDDNVYAVCKDTEFGISQPITHSTPQKYSQDHSVIWNNVILLCLLTHVINSHKHISLLCYYVRHHACDLHSSLL